MLRYRGFQALWLAVAFLCQYSAAWDLEPPAGFSKSLTTSIDQGKQMYTCDTGIWRKSGSSAYLVTNNPQNGGLVRAGNYESTADPTTKRSIMKWTILNSPGDAIESGDQISSVKGVAIYSQNTSEDSVPEVLFEVTSHQGAGAAALVTYIMMTQTKGGQAPDTSLCTEDDIVADVPFDGYFEFYVQDRQPPPTVPAELKPPARVVQGFFVKGKMVFRFDGMKWHSQGIIATIYNVAGGNAIGKFGTIRKPDQYGSNLRWIVDNPNGFTLTGKITGSKKVSDNGAAWQLYEITTSSGTVTSVGPFKYVQLTSTRGGLEPKIAGGATLGLLWKSNFTGICWFYT
ncbi:uncharacterized protein [Physcomitrium patens]|uniref:Uncharacterized protein n=1 Tax=Physcomitrium patens TaxID=3218 RepID=A9T1G5_PHYPA|nr:uncharacterized protein LOC112291750 [Physcomitrium patens]XP_024395379.1 uncharacterized protein LOC112291750 [Physcomitrium patens]PNR40661.1 hypothetical protein PHYPA_018064 [Physcomitrium patens]|eukprot:XP_024395378.1 uncharacterized protein LOC112291750 [Physcomitrella patens]